ncbi:hypothetical protein [Vulgatibacter incomptus]|uniref:PHP domain protein n=1 Tax=Vulgatibacter incomptus TaxID=1391653 RepID=A0A0K1PAR5_9BACT|nr:hypothetical protein [Vulgatibacter incomptus]AKU90615.1 PHP domain protein [Vulgatibacter incomptus]
MNKCRLQTALLASLAAVVLAVAAFGLLVGAIALAPFPAMEASPGPSVRGFFHVHAEKSHDGFGTLDEAVRAAASLGGRFLVLTEHNVLRPDQPVVVDGVLVVPGIEISSDNGHVAAIGLRRDPDEQGTAVLDAIAREGGAAILAHPVNLKRSWSDPSPDGFAGFEALSLDSALRTALAGSWLRLGLAGAALLGDHWKAAALLVDRPDEALARYDELTTQRPVAMLCGTDAHGFPPYLTSFAGLALHVELADSEREAWGRNAAADSEAVVAAVRDARTFCSVPALGDAGSFAFRDSATEVVAEVGVPEARLVLLRDGQVFAEGRGGRLAVPAEPGVWRAEVYVRPGFPYAGDRLWIATSAHRLPR